ncbi:uncharacterized protein LOC104415633 [Eucalyptus grandis]|uniref:uncharacterized protein LOC104415633 n=1 Tax=Eucalyptus grandis TaxID=71139 RepID=UPI00192EB625|nr:uncharacterized protein LOC104415633 [Eucalyptus grandis]
MEFTLSGNALKTLARSVTCPLPHRQRPCHPSFTFPGSMQRSSKGILSLLIFLVYLSVYSCINLPTLTNYSLQAVCSVLRMPISNIDYLSVQLPDINASKVQWALQCFSGIKKTYWITCNVGPDIQQLSLDRRKYPSNFVVRPRDLNRLLVNFQSSLQEITIIATERNSDPSDAASEFGGKAVEFRSYIDPTKENDSLLHTQLWIDPAEEFVRYTHNGNPVDVTFAVKELKAFLAFCEGCEVDIHLFFEKAGK